MDMDTLAILVKAILSLKDTAESEKQIISELPKLEDKLQSNEKARVKIIAGLDVKESNKLIKSQIDSILDKGKSRTIKIGLDINTSAFEKATDKVKRVQTQLQQIFKIDDLKTNNVPYMSKAYNTVEKQMERIKSLAKSQDWELVDVKGIEETTGKVKQLELTIRDCEKTLKKITMQREKLQGNGKSQYGFVQVGDVKILETAEKAQEKLNKSIEKTQEKLTSLEQKWKKQGIVTGEFENQLESLKAKLGNIDSESDLDKYNSSLKIAKENAEELLVIRKQNVGVEKQISSAIDELDGLQNSSTFSKNSFNPQVSKTQNEIKELKSDYQSLLTEFKNSPTPQGLENIKQKLAELDNRFDKTITSAEAFENQLKSDNSAKQLSQKVDLLTQQIKAYLEINTKAANSKEFGGQFSEMLLELTNPNIDIDTFNKLQKKFQVLRQEINATGKAGKTFFETLKAQAEKFSSWMTLTGVITELWQGIRKMVTNVIELDGAMTNLKKVTNETETTYTKFLKNASKQAQKLHSTMVDLVEQVATWSKLGFSLNQAESLANISMIYAKVAEVDNTTAVSDLVTVMKAFNIESEKSIRIVDSLNQLGNTFATDAKSLGEGLTKSASALNAANNSFEQSIALLTGGTEITQNATEMGNALKTISMRIRGMKGELQALGEEYEDVESISKIQTQILNLTGGHTNIFDDNGNFKSTYDILKSISEVYDDLSDPTKADLTEILFGKMRGNQGIALINAFQSGQIEKAYESAISSAGSAQAEFDAWSESIEAHINDFKAAFESLSETVLDSDLIKNLVDGGTTLINVLETIVEHLGTLGTIGLGAGIFAGVKNVGRTKMYVLN